MEIEAEPPSKRRKMTPKLPFFKTLPPEIRTEIYKHAVLPRDTKREKRTFKTVTSDLTINPVDSIQYFFVYKIPYGGKNMVIAEGIMGVPELTDDVLSLILPQILFKFTCGYTLLIFVRIIAHANKKLKKVAGLNVEINLSDMMSVYDRNVFESWEPMRQCQLPHGKFTGMFSDVGIWFKAVAKLPKATTIHLVFSQVWRDFESLRKLSKRYKIPKREITFEFPAPNSPRPDYDFFIAQTIAAVKDIEIPKRLGISDARREELVKIGCTGFELPRRSPRQGGGKRRDGE
ncbi:hypothetical protein V495_04032 [Pseudogymnoascus sp. VKM F-4514 (FW-929)]|nr:hypothetical protein V495_04032 [Pseudogymnoascus sp. VKM F-4514 (FW-929)]KFY59313.1 hypothetical protein V497_04381 [Pseudogymnoascus sp. VKM F-4516 (FW-969)]